MPLTWLGSMYRMVEDAFIDSEKMLGLLDVAPEIKDATDAVQMRVDEGRLPVTCSQLMR